MPNPGGPTAIAIPTFVFGRVDAGGQSRDRIPLAVLALVGCLSRCIYPVGSW